MTLGDELSCGPGPVWAFTTHGNNQTMLIIDRYVHEQLEQLDRLSRHSSECRFVLCESSPFFFSPASCPAPGKLILTQLTVVYLVGRNTGTYCGSCFRFREMFSRRVTPRYRSVVQPVCTVGTVSEVYCAT